MCDRKKPCKLVARVFTTWPWFVSAYVQLLFISYYCSYEYNICMYVYSSSTFVAGRRILRWHIGSKFIAFSMVNETIILIRTKTIEQKNENKVSKIIFDKVLRITRKYLNVSVRFYKWPEITNTLDLVIKIAILWEFDCPYKDMVHFFVKCPVSNSGYYNKN